MVALLTLGLMAGCAGPTTPEAAAGTAEVVAAAVPVAGWHLADGVAIEAAYELRSSDARFGGISGIIVEPGRMLLVSDRGTVWTAKRPTGDQASVPRHWDVQRLVRDGPSWPDSEFLALRPDGTVVVALEGQHALMELPASAGWHMELRFRRACVRRLPTRG